MSKQTKTLTEARHYLLQKKKQAEQNIEKFSEEVKKNPFYAMEWSQKIFTDAAWFTFATGALQDLEGSVDEEDVGRLANHFFRRAMRECRDPSRSTSVTANLAAQERARVYVEAAEYLNQEFWG